MSARTLEDLARMTHDELQLVFDCGLMPDVERLVGWELRGWNQPFITQLGGFRKFRKGFTRRGAEVWGYNVKVRQGGLGLPWAARPSEDRAIHHGFYRVFPLEAGDTSAMEDRCLLLDYSYGDNTLLNGSFLRDYLRQVEEGNEDLYLGKAYVELLGHQLMPGFFILERYDRIPSDSR